MRYAPVLYNTYTFLKHFTIKKHLHCLLLKIDASFALSLLGDSEVTIKLVAFNCIWVAIPDANRARIKHSNKLKWKGTRKCKAKGLDETLQV